MRTLNTRKRISPGIILAVLAMFLAFSCSGGTTDHTGVPTSENPDPEVLITAGDAPQIYNDNVFVMPADTDIASTRPSYESLSAVFYEHFEDVFDFLIIVLNLSPGESRIGYLGSNVSVTNDVRGIGHNTYSNNSLV